jgi:hypothetical protein
VPGVDYKESFALMPRWVAIRTLIALAAEYDLDVSMSMSKARIFRLFYMMLFI